MSFLKTLGGIARTAAPIITSIASLLMGGNLIYDANSNVQMKIANSTTWTPIYQFQQGAVSHLHTKLEITGAPPLPPGYVYQWDRGEADAAPGSYGVVLSPYPENAFEGHMPTSATVALVLKQGAGATYFDGSGVNQPNLGTLPMQYSGQFLQAANGNGSVNNQTATAWGDPEEMIDAKRVYLTGWDHHVEFDGGFQNGEFPGDKLARTNNGDTLFLVAFGTDAPPTVAFPNTWTASDSTLNFGMITGSVSLVWSSS